MSTEFSDSLRGYLDEHQTGVVPVPLLVKGELLYPPRLSKDALHAMVRRGSNESADQRFEGDGVQVIQQPVFDPTTMQATGDSRLLVFPEFDPASLIEHDRVLLAKRLYSMPFRELLDYVKALRQVLEENRKTIEEAAERSTVGALFDGGIVSAFFSMLPQLLDEDGLGRSVDFELGTPTVPGRRYLDEWVPVTSETHPGFGMAIGKRVFGSQTMGECGEALVRAMPTRQIHVTAGNSPFVPFVSFLRALATKSASVIKSPAELTSLTAILAAAMRTVDPNHPITQHTSLVYWQGGNRKYEDVLFADNAFDRLVVWGSPETVHSVRARAIAIKTQYLNPRFGLSLIGNEPFPQSVRQAAVRACCDSMIANQKACTASLVHYVVGSEAEAIEYCEHLSEALSSWDANLPHVLPRSTLGELRLLRRSTLLRGKWFINGSGNDITSAVVYMPDPFDVSLHPMCRFVVVRRLDDADDILPYLNESVSTLGVYPESLSTRIRDAAAASGVSNILPLGQCERIYPGMPHDGMRFLSESVNWVNG